MQAGVMVMDTKFVSSLAGEEGAISAARTPCVKKKKTFIILFFFFSMSKGAAVALGSFVVQMCYRVSVKFG